MNVRLFGKTESPCIANWTLQKTVKDSKGQISFHSFLSLLQNFHQHKRQKLHAYEKLHAYACMSSSKLFQLGDVR